MMKEYYPRVSDKVLQEHLDSKGAVLIEGPKWCGKTTSAKHIANSVIEMDRPDMTDQYQQMARIKPSNLLEGKTPRLIDEWQIATNIWNAVRYEVGSAGRNSDNLFLPVLRFLRSWMKVRIQVRVALYVCVCVRCLCSNPKIQADRFR